MPPAITRAALLPAAAPAAEMAVASLAARMGSLQVGGAFFSPFSSSSSSSSSSTFRCCRRAHRTLLSSSPLRRPLPPPAASSSLAPPSTAAAAAAFSTSPACASRLLRRRMREWFKTGQGRVYRPSNAATGEQEVRRRGRVFPNNPNFASQPVLGERARELLWRKVVGEGQSVKAVAAELQIDMRRVAAVVRLKEMEKAWLQQGKPLATVYARAVLRMLPVNELRSGTLRPHEPINEIHTHAYTKQQLFLPVSESRHFTREDAARAFHPTLLSADQRMPIPELVAVERDVLTGARSYEEGMEHLQHKTAAEQEALLRRDRAAAAAEDARTTRVETGRFQFRIRDIDADNVGPDGRSPRAVGWRYGVPFNDRKRGQVKIPTSVG